MSFAQSLNLFNISFTREENYTHWKLKLIWNSRESNQDKEILQGSINLLQKWTHYWKAIYEGDFTKIGSLLIDSREKNKTSQLYLLEYREGHEREYRPFAFLHVNVISSVISEGRVPFLSTSILFNPFSYYYYEHAFTELVNNNYAMRQFFQILKKNKIPVERIGFLVVKLPSIAAYKGLFESFLNKKEIFISEGWTLAELPLSTTIHERKEGFDVSEKRTRKKVVSEYHFFYRSPLFYSWIFSPQVQNKINAAIAFDKHIKGKELLDERDIYRDEAFKHFSQLYHRKQRELKKYFSEHKDFEIFLFTLKDLIERFFFSLASSKKNEYLGKENKIYTLFEEIFLLLQENGFSFRIYTNKSSRFTMMIKKYFDDIIYTYLSSLNTKGSPYAQIFNDDGEISRDFLDTNAFSRKLSLFMPIMLKQDEREIFVGAMFGKNIIKQSHYGYPRQLLSTILLREPFRGFGLGKFLAYYAISQLDYFSLTDLIIEDSLLDHAITNRLTKKIGLWDYGVIPNTYYNLDLSQYFPTIKIKDFIRKVRVLNSYIERLYHENLIDLKELRKHKNTLEQNRKALILLKTLLSKNIVETPL